MTYQQEIKSTDVGSLEEVLGTGDPLFKPEAPTAKPVDLADSQVAEEDVTTEDFGKGEADGENTVTENMKDITIEEAADAAGLTVMEYIAQQTVTAEKPVKDIPEELPIEYLFNPNNKKIFPVNKDIIRQKFLIPCTKDGKLLPDFRRPSDFR